MVMTLTVKSRRKEGGGIPCFTVKTRRCVRERCVWYSTPRTQVRQSRQYLIHDLIIQAVYYAKSFSAYCVTHFDVCFNVFLLAQ